MRASSRWTSSASTLPARRCSTPASRTAATLPTCSASPAPCWSIPSEGSSLTYQNVQEVFRLWVRAGLQINYLVPIEAAMSDLLPRSTAARFNVDSFERADPKARWETYKLMGEVLGTEEAAQIARESEGFAPGDVEFLPAAPVRSRRHSRLACRSRAAQDPSAVHRHAGHRRHPQAL